MGNILSELNDDDALGKVGRIILQFSYNNLRKSGVGEGQIINGQEVPYLAHVRCPKLHKGGKDPTQVRKRMH